MILLHKSVQVCLSLGVSLCLGVAMTNAGDKVPFKSKGEITITYQNGNHLEGVDVGVGTHLGRYTSVYHVDVFPVWDEGVVVSLLYEGSFVSTAADGSTLTVDLNVEEPLDRPGEAIGTATIRGGTGRFDGATGSWESVAVHTSPATFVYESVGEISNRGQSKR